jgi:hypothetical protein
MLHSEPGVSANLTAPGSTLPTPSPEALANIYEVERRVRETKQIEIPTEHLIHGGMYARTVRLAQGVLIVGVLIKVPTVVIVNGDTVTLAGDQWTRLTGYNVIPGGAGRKQIFLALQPTELTMLFPTKAKTVEEAEAEFTDEADRLLSRHQEFQDLVTITGV